MGKSSGTNRQAYLNLKKEHRRIKAQERWRVVLFWRVGDFMETYFEDAEMAVKVLGIGWSCTREGVDMAAVPRRESSACLARMVKAGFKVAVCEPQGPYGRPGWTKYEVVRVVSPGLDCGEREFVTAPPLPEERPKSGGLLDMAQKCFSQIDELRAEVQETKKAARKLYEERTGQKWQPSLSVVQGGGKRRKKKARRPAMTLLDGGRG